MYLSYTKRENSLNNSFKVKELLDFSYKLRPSRSHQYRSKLYTYSKRRKAKKLNTVMASSLRCCMLIVLLVLTSNSGIHVSARVSLFTNQSLRVNEQLITRSFSLSMQGDCNLVLRDNTRVLWSTSTAGWGTNCRVTMQDDGNLVVYNDQGALWASNTWRQGKDTYELILQEDRNLVIYKGAARTAIWSTRTQFLASE